MFFLAIRTDWTKAFQEVWANLGCVVHFHVPERKRSDERRNGISNKAYLGFCKYSKRPLCIAATTIAETTTIGQIIGKTTILEEIELLSLFTGLEDKKSLDGFFAIAVVCCMGLVSDQ